MFIEGRKVQSLHVSKGCHLSSGWPATSHGTEGGSTEPHPANNELAAFPALTGVGLHIPRGALELENKLQTFLPHRHLLREERLWGLRECAPFPSAASCTVVLGCKALELLSEKVLAD